jgi:hypothetical protein
MARWAARVLLDYKPFYFFSNEKRPATKYKNIKECYNRAVI